MDGFLATKGNYPWIMDYNMLLKEFPGIGRVLGPFDQVEAVPGFMEHLIEGVVGRNNEKDSCQILAVGFHEGTGFYLADWHRGRRQADPPLRRSIIVGVYRTEGSHDMDDYGPCLFGGYELPYQAGNQVIRPDWILDHTRLVSCTLEPIPEVELAVYIAGSNQERSLKVPLELRSPQTITGIVRQDFETGAIRLLTETGNSYDVGDVGKQALGSKMEIKYRGGIPTLPEIDKDW